MLTFFFIFTLDVLRVKRQILQRITFGHTTRYILHELTGKMTNIFLTKNYYFK